MPKHNDIGLANINFEFEICEFFGCQNGLLVDCYADALLTLFEEYQTQTMSSNSE